ncbi:MAG: hypothetical protein NC321_16140 [Clostridium sp.]|nr:hypothetical protein [Clostridium sp.]
MTYKKTWISYLLWAFYTCAVGVILADYAILFWQGCISENIGYDTVLFVFLIFAGVVGCHFLIRKILSVYHSRDKEKKKDRISGRMALVWEVFIALGIFFTGLLYRICLYLHSVPDMIITTQYYHAATLKAGTGIEPITHGASYLYTVCLSFALSFLGNKAAAAVWMQIFIQMLTILLAFFTIRKIAGRIPACIAMLTLAASSVYAGQIFILTAESLFFLLYLAGLWVIGSYIRLYHEDSVSIALKIAGAVLSGALLGILCYLDAVSLTLLFLLPALFTRMRKQAKGREISAFSVKVRVAFLILTLVSGALAFMGMLAIDASYSGGRIIQAMEAWLSLYQNHLGADYIFYQTNRSLIECLVLVVSAAFLIMSFWNRKKEQNASFWICLMFVLAPTPLTAAGYLPYQVFSIFIWSVLAGIGVQQSFVWEEKQMVKTTSTSEAQLKSAEDDREDKPRFIENPLPLPKKHEKRTMDYQYEVAQDKMDFDIEVKDNDDFDVL